jgi:hypothetical protein
MKEMLCLKKVKIKKEHIGRNCFYPVYGSDRDMLGKCNYDDPVLCSTRKVRNPRHHKLIFAIAKCVIANLPDENLWSKATPYFLIKSIMFAEGIVDEYTNLDGTKRLEAKHINFATMDEDEFQKVSDAVFKWGAKLLEIDEQNLRVNYFDYL